MMLDSRHRSPGSSRRRRQHRRRDSHDKLTYTPSQPINPNDTNATANAPSSAAYPDLDPPSHSTPTAIATASSRRDNISGREGVGFGTRDRRDNHGGAQQDWMRYQEHQGVSRPRASSDTSGSYSSSSVASFLEDISRHHPTKTRYGGIFGTFWRAPSERRTLRRRRSGRAAKRRVLYLGNSSSSSVNSDLAYGNGYISRTKLGGLGTKNRTISETYTAQDATGKSRRLGAKEYERSSQSTLFARRGDSKRDKTDEEIISLGRQLSQIAKKQNEHDLRAPGKKLTGLTAAAVAATALKEGRKSTRDDKSRGIGSSRTHRSYSDSSDESDWEDASDDEAGQMSEAESAMAYGSIVSQAFRPSRSSPTSHRELKMGAGAGAGVGAAVGAGLASQTGRTGPFWRPAESLPRKIGNKSSLVDPRLFGPQNSLRGMVNTPCGFGEDQPAADYQHFNKLRRADSEPPQRSPRRDDQSVPTTDPSLFKVGAASDSTSHHVPYRSRPAPIPIQQPSPMAPVSSKVYQAERFLEQESRPELAVRAHSRSNETGLGQNAKLTGLAAAAAAAVALASDRKSKRESRRHERRQERKEPISDIKDLAEDTERRDRNRRLTSDMNNAREKGRDSERRGQDRESDILREPKSDKYPAQFPNAPGETRLTQREEEEPPRKRREKTKDYAPEAEPSRMSMSRRSDGGRDRDRDREFSTPSRRDDLASENRDKRRKREAATYEAFDMHRPSASMPGVDPFQFQIADGIGTSLVSAATAPARPLTPNVVTADREPKFNDDDDRPPRLAHSDTRLSRKDSFEMEHELAAYGQTAREPAPEPTSWDRKYEGPEHQSSKIYTEAEHSTAPIVATAIASAAAVEMGRAEERRRDAGLSHDNDSRPAKDAVQEEADRYYREVTLARKIAAEEENSPGEGMFRNPSYTVVNPPAGEDQKPERSPYAGPDADVKIDNKIYPKELHQFQAKDFSSRSFTSWDPSCERERPLLNLVYPTPVSSRQPTPSLPQQNSYEADEKARESRDDSAVSSREEVKDESKGKDKKRRSKKKSRLRNDTIDDVDQAAAPSTISSSAKSVSWGENSTKSFEVENYDARSGPQASRIEFESGREQPDEEPQPQPGQAGRWGTIATTAAAAAVPSIASSSSAPVTELEDKKSRSKKKAGSDVGIDHRDKSAREWDGFMDEARSEPPIPGPKPVGPSADKMPGSFADDVEFAATLAAGLQDTGFNPDIVIDDPAYRRRESPPHSSEPHGDEWKPSSFSDAIAELPSKQKAVSEPGFFSEPLEMAKEDTAFTSNEWAESSDKPIRKGKKKQREMEAKKKSLDLAEPLIPDPAGPSVPEDTAENRQSDREKKKREKAKRRSMENSEPLIAEPSEPLAPEDVWDQSSSKDQMQQEPESWAEETPAGKPRDDTHTSLESRDVGWEDYGKKTKEKSRRTRDFDDDDGASRTHAHTESVDNISTSQKGGPGDDWDTRKKAKSKSSRDSGGRGSATGSEVGDGEGAGKRRSKPKHRSNSDFDEIGDGPADRKKDPWEDRDVNSVVSEARADSRRRRVKRSSLYDDGDNDDAKSVASAPAPSSSRKTKRSSHHDDDEDARSSASRTGSSRRGRDKESEKSEKKSSGLFATLFKGNNKDEVRKLDKESFLDDAGTLGAGVGLATAAAAAIASSSRPNAAHTAHSFPKELEDKGVDDQPRSQFRNFDSEIVPHVIKPAIDPQYGDLLPLPPSEPGSPKTFHQDLPALPDSRPGTPSEERIFARDLPLHHQRRSLQETPAKSPSTTAIPISLRLGQRHSGPPSSPRTFRSTPSGSQVTTPESPRRQARISWDSGKEIKPLYLLKHSRQGSIDDIAQGDLPSLPSNEEVDPPSREAHVSDTAERHAKADLADRGVSPDMPTSRDLRIDTATAASVAVDDISGSQQTTPKATTKPQLPLVSIGQEAPDSCTSTGVDPESVDAVSRDTSSDLPNPDPSPFYSNEHVAVKPSLDDLSTSLPSSGLAAESSRPDNPEDLTSADEHFSDALERPQSDTFEEARDWFHDVTPSGTLSGQDPLDQPAPQPLAEPEALKTLEHPDEPASSVHDAAGTTEQDAEDVTVGQASTGPTTSGAAGQSVLPASSTSTFASHEVEPDELKKPSAKEKRKAKMKSRNLALAGAAAATAATAAIAHVSANDPAKTEEADGSDKPDDHFKTPKKGKKSRKSRRESPSLGDISLDAPGAGSNAEEDPRVSGVPLPETQASNKGEETTGLEHHVVDAQTNANVQSTSIAHDKEEKESFPYAPDVCEASAEQTGETPEDKSDSAPFQGMALEAPAEWSGKDSFVAVNDLTRWEDGQSTDVFFREAPAAEMTLFAEAEAAGNKLLDKDTDFSQEHRTDHPDMTQPQATENLQELQPPPTQPTNSVDVEGQEGQKKEKKRKDLLVAESPPEEEFHSEQGPTEASLWEEHQVAESTADLPKTTPHTASHALAGPDEPRAATDFSSPANVSTAPSQDILVSQGSHTTEEPDVPIQAPAEIDTPEEVDFASVTKSKGKKAKKKQRKNITQLDEPLTSAPEDSGNLAEAETHLAAAEPSAEETVMPIQPSFDSLEERENESVSDKVERGIYVETPNMESQPFPTAPSNQSTEETGGDQRSTTEHQDHGEASGPNPGSVSLKGKKKKKRGHQADAAETPDVSMLDDQPQDVPLEIDSSLDKAGKELNPEIAATSLVEESNEPTEQKAADSTPDVVDRRKKKKKKSKGKAVQWDESPPDVLSEAGGTSTLVDNVAEHPEAFEPEEGLKFEQKQLEKKTDSVPLETSEALFPQVDSPFEASRAEASSAAAIQSNANAVEAVPAGDDSFEPIFPKRKGKKNKKKAAQAEVWGPLETTVSEDASADAEYSSSIKEHGSFAHEESAKKLDTEPEPESVVNEPFHEPIQEPTKGSAEQSINEPVKEPVSPFDNDTSRGAVELTPLEVPRDDQAETDWSISSRSKLSKKKKKKGSKSVPLLEADNVLKAPTEVQEEATYTGQPWSIEEPPQNISEPSKRADEYTSAMEAPALTKEPELIDELVAAEEPASIEKPASPEGLTFPEKPQSPKEPSFAADPASSDEPALLKEPVLPEESASRAERALSEGPAFPEQIVLPDESELAAEPAIPEEPALSGTPTRSEPPTLGEETTTAKSALCEDPEEPTLTEKIFLVEKLVNSEEPELPGEPPATAESALSTEHDLPEEPRIPAKAMSLEEPTSLRGFTPSEEPAMLQEPVSPREPAFSEEERPLPEKPASFEGPALIAEFALPEEPTSTAELTLQKESPMPEDPERSVAFADVDNEVIADEGRPQIEEKSELERILDQSTDPKQQEQLTTDASVKSTEPNEDSASAPVEDEWPQATGKKAKKKKKRQQQQQPPRLSLIADQSPGRHPEAELPAGIKAPLMAEAEAGTDLEETIPVVWGADKWKQSLEISTENPDAERISQEPSERPVDERSQSSIQEPSIAKKQIPGAVTTDEAYVTTEDKSHSIKSKALESGPSQDKSEPYDPEALSAGPASPTWAGPSEDTNFGTLTKASRKDKKKMKKKWAQSREPSPSIDQINDANDANQEASAPAAPAEVKDVIESTLETPVAGNSGERQIQPADDWARPSTKQSKKEKKKKKAKGSQIVERKEEEIEQQPFAAERDTELAEKPSAKDRSEFDNAFMEVSTHPSATEYEEPVSLDRINDNRPGERSEGGSGQTGLFSESGLELFKKDKRETEEQEALAAEREMEVKPDMSSKSTGLTAATEEERDRQGKLQGGVESSWTDTPPKKDENNKEAERGSQYDAVPEQSVLLEDAEFPLAADARPEDEGIESLDLAATAKIPDTIGPSDAVQRDVNLGALESVMTDVQQSFPRPHDDLAQTHATEDQSPAAENSALPLTQVLTNFASSSDFPRDVFGTPVAKDQPADSQWSFPTSSKDDSANKNDVEEEKGSPLRIEPELITSGSLLPLVENEEISSEKTKDPQNVPSEPTSVAARTEMLGNIPADSKQAEISPERFQMRDVVPEETLASSSQAPIITSRDQLTPSEGRDGSGKHVAAEYEQRRLSLSDKENVVWQGLAGQVDDNSTAATLASSPVTDHAEADASAAVLQDDTVEAAASQDNYSPEDLVPSKKSKKDKKKAAKEARRAQATTGLAATAAASIASMASHAVIESKERDKERIKDQQLEQEQVREVEEEGDRPVVAVEPVQMQGKNEVEAPLSTTESNNTAKEASQRDDECLENKDFGEMMKATKGNFYGLITRDHQASHPSPFTFTESSTGQVAREVPEPPSFLSSEGQIPSDHSKEVLEIASLSQDEPKTACSGPEAAESLNFVNADDEWALPTKKKDKKGRKSGRGSEAVKSVEPTPAYQPASSASLPDIPESAIEQISAPEPAIEPDSRFDEASAEHSAAVNMVKDFVAVPKKKAKKGKKNKSNRSAAPTVDKPNEEPAPLEEQQLSEPAFGNDMAEESGDLVTQEKEIVPVHFSTDSDKGETRSGGAGSFQPPEGNDDDQSSAPRAKTEDEMAEKSTDNGATMTMMSPVEALADIAQFPSSAKDSVSPPETLPSTVLSPTEEDLQDEYAEGAPLAKKKIEGRGKGKGKGKGKEKESLPVSCLVEKSDAAQKNKTDAASDDLMSASNPEMAPAETNEIFRTAKLHGPLPDEPLPGQSTQNVTMNPITVEDMPERGFDVVDRSAGWQDPDEPRAAPAAERSMKIKSDLARTTLDPVDSPSEETVKQAEREPCLFSGEHFAGNENRSGDDFMEHGRKLAKSKEAADPFVSSPGLAVDKEKSEFARDAAPTENLLSNTASHGDTVEQVGKDSRLQSRSPAPSKNSSIRKTEVLATAGALTGGVALLAEKFGGSQKKKRKGKQKITLDKREPQEDIFDDPVLWEGADKKGIDDGKDADLQDDFWGATAMSGKEFEEIERFGDTPVPGEETPTKSDGRGKEAPHQEEEPVDDDELAESPILGLVEAAEMMPMGPAGLLRQSPGMREAAGGLLRGTTDAESDSMARSLSSEPGFGQRSLPVVQEVEEVEEAEEAWEMQAEGERERRGEEQAQVEAAATRQDKWPIPDKNRDSGFVPGSPELRTRRRLVQSDDGQQRDSGVHTDDHPDDHPEDHHLDNDDDDYTKGKVRAAAASAASADVPFGLVRAERRAEPQPDSPGIRNFQATTPLQAPQPPPLRRIDKRMSGDLRTLGQHISPSQTSASPPPPPAAPTPPPPPPPPVANESRIRVKEDMADVYDVYDGYGQGRIGSPRSPTRPHSMRRRQSMQVLELESKVEQLLAENRVLSEARAIAERSVHQKTAGVVIERDAEIESLKQSLHFLQNEVARLTEVNAGLTSANAELASKDNGRFVDMTRELDQARGAHTTFTQSLQDKDAEIADLRAQLDEAKEQVRQMQRKILESKADGEGFLSLKDEDYFDQRCQQLCSHVQQWVLRFSKFSDMRACRLTSEINDEKTIDRLDNAVLDGSDVDLYLRDRVKRRDIFLSMTMNMIWEFVFTRYLFGMDREQRQKLKSLEKLLTEVGPVQAVRQWRAVTLTLLSKRDGFRHQRDLDTEAVVQAVFQTLCKILPPPSNLESQILSQLRRVMHEAVDLSIEMRSQRAEYMMLPPLQPEYDADGELATTVTFDAAMMNERSGHVRLTNEELEAQRAVVRVVLFPLVVKRGDDEGVGDDKVVICPAQVLVVRDEGNRRHVTPSSDAGGASLRAPSHVSVVTESMGTA